MTLYKFTNNDGSSCNGGTGRWPLPTNGTPGKWLTVKGKLVPCKNGLHVCKREHVFDWLGPALWVVEIDGEVAWDENKGVARKARLVRRVETYNDRTLRLLAADCAERVLPL